MKHPITGLDHSPVVCPHHHVSSSANSGQCMQCDKQRLNTTGMNLNLTTFSCILFFISSINTWSTYKNKYNDPC